MSTEPEPAPLPPYDDVTLDAVLAGIYNDPRTRPMKPATTPAGILLQQLANEQVTAARHRQDAEARRREAVYHDDERAEAIARASNLEAALRTLIEPTP